MVGTLPASLTLSSGGLVSGTPTAAGTFSVKVTDAGGATATSCTFTINPTLSLPCPTTTSGVVNVPFSSQLTATGGTGSYTYSATGSLSGLALSSTGLVSGTPNAAGTFTIKVTDGSGATATSCTFTINTSLSLPCPTTTSGVVGAAFSSQLTATGGTGPFTYSVVSAQPVGSDALSSTGLVSGTPNAAGTFTIKVTDADGATATSCTFTISSALTLPCPSNTSGEIGVAASTARFQPRAESLRILTRSSVRCQPA